MAGDVDEVVDHDTEDAEAQAAFDAEADPGKKPTATPAPVEEKPVAEEPPPAPEPPPVEYAQITKAELEELKAKAGRVDGAYGRIGSVEHTLKQLQAADGQPVVFTKEDFPELAREYPELAEAHVKDMNKAMAKFKVPKGGSTEEFEGKVQTAVAGVAQQFEAKLLKVYHPDWQQVAQDPEFNAWKATLPEDERTTLESTFDAEFIADRITAFKKTKAAKPPVPTPSTRKQQLAAAAASPRGTGAALSANPNSDEAAQKAFDDQFKDT